MTYTTLKICYSSDNRTSNVSQRRNVEPASATGIVDHFRGKMPELALNYDSLTPTLPSSPSSIRTGTSGALS